ncbi:MAG: (p)ppGpp synthetase [Bacteroidota bacterium]
MTTIESQILGEYKTKEALLSEFKDRLEKLLTELLKENKIVVHQVPARVKTFESLSKKLDKKKGKYNSFSDLTDIVGLRIIVYLENEVDIVADMIRKEFVIDEVNSVDKRKLASDSFGYKSLHYVVNLSEQRIALTENKKFKDIKAEIQIRSILQHAWAEIEHDIGYKGEHEIPEQHKRTFSRIAALLETADLEFVRLKGELSAYEKDVNTRINRTPESVPIDKASVISYIRTSDIVQKIDQEIVSMVQAKVDKENILYEPLLNKFSYFNLTSIKELDDILKSNSDGVLKFAKIWLKDSSYEFLSEGISLFYLLYYLSGKTESEEKILEYMNYGGAEIAGGVKTARRIIDTYKQTQ